MQNIIALLYFVNWSYSASDRPNYIPEPTPNVLESIQSNQNSHENIWRDVTIKESSPIQRNLEEIRTFRKQKFHRTVDKLSAPPSELKVKRATSRFRAASLYKAARDGTITKIGSPKTERQTYILRFKEEAFPYA